MLIYDQPISQAKPDARPDAAPAPGGFSVFDLVQLVWRRKIAIASAALICACIAVATGKSLTPKYALPPSSMSTAGTAGGSRTDAAGPGISGLAMVVESQARLIRRTMYCCGDPRQIWRRIGIRRRRQAVRNAARPVRH
jgi:uncharacterized protein involved in exopolysaccharide biosynthesis